MVEFLNLKTLEACSWHLKQLFNHLRLTFEIWNSNSKQFLSTMVCMAEKWGLTSVRATNGYNMGWHSRNRRAGRRELSCNFNACHSPLNELHWQWHSILANANIVWIIITTKQLCSYVIVTWANAISHEWGEAVGEEREKKNKGGGGVERKQYQRYQCPNKEAKNGLCSELIEWMHLPYTKPYAANTADTFVVFCCLLTGGTFQSICSYRSAIVINQHSISTQFNSLCWLGGCCRTRFKHLFLN